MVLITGYKVTYQIMLKGVVELYWNQGHYLTNVMNSSELSCLLSVLNSGGPVYFDQIKLTLTCISSHQGFTIPNQLDLEEIV